MANFWNYAKEHGIGLFEAGKGSRKRKPSKSEKKVFKMIKKEKSEIKKRLLKCLELTQNDDQKKTLLSLYEFSTKRLLTYKQKRLLYRFEFILGLRQSPQSQVSLQPVSHLSSNELSPTKTESQVVVDREKVIQAELQKKVVRIKKQFLYVD